MVRLGELCSITTGKKDVNQGNPNGNYPFFTCAKTHTFADSYSFDTEALLIAGNGDVGTVKYYNGKFEAYQRTYVLSQFSERVVSRYLYFVLAEKFQETVSKLKLGNTMPYIKQGMLTDFLIPLPPLSMQKEIVDRVEGYQRLIDGAQQVVQSFKPNINLNPDWQKVKLGEIGELKNGINYTRESSGAFVKVLGVRDFKSNLYAPLASFDTVQIDSELNGQYLLKENDIVFVRSNGNQDLIGRSVIIPRLDFKATFSGFTIRLRFNSDKVLPLFFAYLLKTDLFRRKLVESGTGANIKSLNQTSLKDLDLPLPPLEEQKQIVAQIESEQSLVNANKELITIYEQKIKDEINELWEQEQPLEKAQSQTL